MLNLDSKISKISGVGETIAKRLKILGLDTVQDLLFYWPFRYDDFTTTATIKNLQANINTNIIGRVELIQNKRSPRKRMNITEALVTDDSGQIKIVWFNQPFIIKNIHEGDQISLSGKVEKDYSGLIMKSPEYEKIFNQNSTHTQGMVPNYHLTANITQKQLRFVIKKIIHLSDKLSDWLPKEIQKKVNLPTLSQAIEKIHFPESQNDINKAKRRLSFDELFLVQLQSQTIKKEIQSYQANKIKFSKKETKEFVDNLPFTLTDGQKKAAWEILQDIEKNIPMNRMVEGDVGSGKTIVAVMAMLNVALKKGKQSVLMAPTEILAKQHFESISKTLKDYDIKIGLVTRSEKISNQAKGEKIKLEKITADHQIIIGTHALIQKDVSFKNLSLVIVDEQHRFGVGQRKALIQKSNSKNVPHFLSMTATPIPRSLALVLYGDLDISIIEEMPKNRKKIITKIVSEAKREQAYEFINNQIKEGRQVFIICPLVDISDKMGLKSVKQEFKKLDEKVFPDLKIELLHGKLKATEKEKILNNFLKNKTKIIISTSVVEVGIDIPNATVMMIEDADRFGLAQLHQFRGRVGRGEHQSYCFLFTGSDAPATLSRLQSLVDCNNGFDLARADLKQRGPGQVYGTEQKGFPEFKMASLFDHGLIKEAQQEAIKILGDDPELNGYPDLQEKLKKQNENIHLE